MKPPYKANQFKLLLSYFLLAVAIIAAYKIILNIEDFAYLANKFINTISPFIFGFLLAYTLNIPCGIIQKLLAKIDNSFIRKRGKAISIILTYMLLFFTIFLTLRLLIPYVYRNVYHFIENFQAYYKSIEEIINYVNNLNILEIDISMDKIISAVRNFSLEALSSSVKTIFGVSSALFGIFLTFISSIFIMFEKDRFKKYFGRLIKAFFSDKTYSIMLKYIRNLNMNCKKYIYTQVVVGCIFGAISALELYLLGSRYAAMLGIMLGIMNCIPYFGSIIGSVIVIIIVTFSQNVQTGLLTAVILLITQQIDGNVIQPKLMGERLALSPLLVIIGVTIGGTIGGVMGMIVVIPIVATLKSIFEDIIVYYEHKKIAKLNCET